jgi:hypothetical protein
MLFYAEIVADTTTQNEKRDDLKFDNMNNTSPTNTSQKLGQTQILRKSKKSLKIPKG